MEDYIIGFHRHKLDKVVEENKVLGEDDFGRFIAIVRERFIDANNSGIGLVIPSHTNTEGTITVLKNCGNAFRVRGVFHHVETIAHYLQ